MAVTGGPGRRSPPAAGPGSGLGPVLLQGSPDVPAAGRAAQRGSSGFLGGRGLGPAGLGLFWGFPFEPGQLRVCPGLRAQRAGLQAPVEAQRLGLHGLCFSAGIYATEGGGEEFIR